MKIRNKVPFFFLPIVLLSVVTMTLFSKRVVERVLVEETVKRGLAISLDLAQSLDMVRSFKEGDEKILLPALLQVREKAALRYVMVLDLEGRVLAHTNVMEKGRLYQDPVTLQAVKSDQPENKRLAVEEQLVMDISFPVWEVERTQSGEEFLLLGRREVRAKERLGTIRLGLPLDEILQTADSISLQVFWVITAVSLLAMALVLFYVRSILRPVHFLAEATEKIGQGQLGEIVPVLSQDELGDLATSFNQMSQDLATTTVSRDFLDSILRNMQDILLVTDRDGAIRLCNYSTQVLLSYSEEELVGRSVERLLGEELFTAAQLEEWVSQEENNSVDTVLLTRTGTAIPVLLSSALFLSRDEEEEGFIFTAIDIAERKQAEGQLRTSLEEKELLLKEIHHRVKNNLQVISSLLSLQTRNIRDEAALEMFADSQNRIRSMALIHEKLYQSEDLARVDFASYIETLVAHLFQSYQVRSQRVRLVLEVENLYLGIDKAIPCGLIINELVSNALKHAFPEDREGSMKIRLAQVGAERFMVAVSDDGVGFPEGVDHRTTETLGLKLVNILVRQLNGEIELKSEGGTEFAIEIPGI